MTPAPTIADELAALDPMRMPAATLLREVENMAHRLGREAGGAGAADLRALHEAAAELKARIAARVATTSSMPKCAASGRTISSGEDDTTNNRRPAARCAATRSDRKSTRLNSSHSQQSRMPSSA